MGGRRKSDATANTGHLPVRLSGCPRRRRGMPAVPTIPRRPRSGPPKGRCADRRHDRPVRPLLEQARKIAMMAAARAAQRTAWDLEGGARSSAVLDFFDPPRRAKQSGSARSAEPSNASRTRARIFRRAEQNEPGGQGQPRDPGRGRRRRSGSSSAQVQGQNDGDVVNGGLPGPTGPGTGW